MQNNYLSEEFALPNPSLSSAGGLAYVKAILKDSAVVYKNLKHKKIIWGNDVREGFDIFLPKDIKDHKCSVLPVFMFIHGGYCVNGCREMMAFIAPMITQMPAIFVSLGYKLAPKHSFAESLFDCKQGFLKAIQLLPFFGGDPQNIILAGHSIGATFAALLILQKSLLPKNIVRDSIRACISLSGIFNLNTVPEDKKRLILKQAKDARKFSPLALEAKSNTVPFLLFYGENDFANIKADQAPMLEKIQASNANLAQAFQLPKKDHFETTLTFLDKEYAWPSLIQALFQNKRKLSKCTQSQDLYHDSL